MDSFWFIIIIITTTIIISANTAATATATQGFEVMVLKVVSNELLELSYYVYAGNELGQAVKRVADVGHISENVAKGLQGLGQDTHLDVYLNVKWGDEGQRQDFK